MTLVRYFFVAWAVFVVCFLTFLIVIDAPLWEILVTAAWSVPVSVFSARGVWRLG